MFRGYHPNSWVRCVARDNEGEEVRKKDVPTGNEKFAGNSAEKIGPPKQLLKGSPRKKGEAKRRGGGNKNSYAEMHAGKRVLCDSPIFPKISVNVRNEDLF